MGAAWLDSVGALEPLSVAFLRQVLVVYVIPPGWVMMTWLFVLPTRFDVVGVERRDLFACHPVVL